MSYRLTDTFRLDDRTYRLEDIKRIYKAWTPMLWMSKELYKLDEKTFVIVSRSPIIHKSNHGDIKILTQLGDIAEAIKMNAPDDTLRELGVTIHQPDTRPKDTFHLLHRDTTFLSYKKPGRNYRRYLVLNYDGGLIDTRLLTFDCLGYSGQWTRHLTQREATLFTARARRYAENALETMGISPA